MPIIIILCVEFDQLEYNSCQLRIVFTRKYYNAESVILALSFRVT